MTFPNGSAFFALGRRTATWPPIIWMLAGFVLAYILFFVGPIFLNTAHVMQFPRYVPYSEPIGDDLRIILSWSKIWEAGGNPYGGMSLHPPLSWLIFYPLRNLPLATAYLIMTSVTLLCLIVLNLAVPIWFNRGGYSRSMLVLCFLSGLFAYGTQFELERGQFNVLTMTMCVVSVGLYYRRTWPRWLALGLFSLSIQFKLWPGVFVLMFLQDWRAWRQNLFVLLSVASANIALLFILGTNVFAAFVRSVSVWSASGYPWRGNHSIASFVSTGVSAVAALRPGDSFWSPALVGPVSFLLLIVVLAALVLILLQGHPQHAQAGPNAYLLLACTIAALVLPSISNDYTLSFLSGAVAVLVCSGDFLMRRQSHHPLLSSVLLLLFSFAYSSTLYSYTNKPLVLRNNLPALMVMLAVTAVWAVMDRGGRAAESVPSA